MIVYTTCAGCGGLLQHTDGLNHHNGWPTPCTPKPSRLDQLANQWRDAALTGDTAREKQLANTIAEIQNQPPRLLAAALTYASWSWPVFPLKTPAMAQRHPDPYKAAKTPATKNGFKDATTDPDRIRAWWTRHPDSGIGLPTGHAFDVIDLDMPEALHAYLKLADTTDLDIHGHVATASAGIHLYIKPTGKSNKARDGIDYRGLGGYVIAPPTQLLNNPRHAYGWVTKPSPIITGQGDTFGR